MTWTAPRTWVTGEVVTAALLNTHLRDNLLTPEPTGILKAIGGLVVGTGTVRQTKQLRATATWDPASTGPQSDDVTDITVTGAVLGDQAEASFSVASTDEMHFVARVRAADTVRVLAVNEADSTTTNLGSGTLEAVVTGYAAS